MTGWRQKVAGVLLGAVLLQVMLFWVGFLVPARRIAILWGKSRQERLHLLWQPGFVLSQVAERFPADARIYMVDPELLIHWNAIYYFYPRLVTVTMTNGNYRTREAYATWNERPSQAWLVSNHFTHVISFKDGIRAWPVTSLPKSFNATE